MKILKMKALALVFAACCLSFSSCQTRENTPKMTNLTQFVDPYIGTGDHGHVFMGANVPFGLVQLGPTQLSQGWDWCSGYHYSDSTIIGFGHMHLSGTGIGDLGDIAYMPVTEDVEIHKGKSHDDYSTGFFSKFSHDNEIARAGYYSVHLDRYNVDVELTATSRVGLQKYSYPTTADARVILDLAQGIGWDAPVEGFVQQENDTVISGYRYSKGWAKDQKIYFTTTFSEPIQSLELYNKVGKLQNGTQFKNQVVYAQLKFGSKLENPLFVKTALSPVSIKNAKENMTAELSGWNFNQVKVDADKAWNKQLNKIKVTTNSVKNKRVFYTSLYHSMVAPSTFSDVNGDHRGADGSTYNDPSFVSYTTLSLWDTYRAAHPLATIIHPDKMKDYAQTFLHIFKEQGKLPVWHLVGNETDCMVGNPGIPVLADIVLKGYNVDAKEALNAMVSSALLDERNLDLVKKYGYVPYEKGGAGNVSQGLEYALADWCVAQVAQKTGNKELYNKFSKRAKNYKYYFDKKTNFVRGLSAEGKFREPFNPFHSVHQGDDYTEGNAWQYTWLVPHDIPGLVDLFGGEEPFVSKLDSLFVVEGDMGKDASPDISGLVGQYAHGNEPGHHILYMYAYVGQVWKTAEKVRYVLNNLYNDEPAGLSGNEDVGQMSSWYVMSALGFYQVAPAGGTYVFGSPLFDKAEVKVGDNKTFTVVAHNNSDTNIYIQSAKLNGKPYTKSYITHQEIAKGGTLEFEMGSEPSDFGKAIEDRP